MSRAEYFARECRKALGIAHQLEVSGDIEYADAAGAVAVNKLTQAVRLNNVVPLPSLVVECPACDGGWRDTERGTVRCGQCNGTGRVATNGGER